jgi:hypothetical protein
LQCVEPDRQADERVDRDGVLQRGGRGLRDEEDKEQGWSRAYASRVIRGALAGSEVVRGHRGRLCSAHPSTV